MIDAGIPLRQISRYELDHVVPLELGGHPRALANLKLQLWPEARVKDKLENRLNRLVCQGKMPLEEARNCIYDDWKSCSLTH